jgi:hypothetical protein
MAETTAKVDGCDTLTGLSEPRAAARSKRRWPKVTPSPPDCDIIFGGRAIARWLGLSYQQARPLIRDGSIPTFKMGRHTKRCALKSVLNETFAKYAQRQPLANAPAEEKSCNVTGVTKPGGMSAS